MLSQTTHATLLARIASGPDDAAWREFVDRYGELIRGFGRRRGLCDADCDDLVQEVLSSLMSALPRFRYDPARGRFRGYLKTVTVRAISRRACQNGGAAPLEDSDESALADEGGSAADEQWEVEWRRHHLRIAMRTIDQEFNPADRAAFRRYAVEGEPAAETAAALGLSIDQVYQAKSRILRRLGQLVAAQVADEG